MTDRGPIKELGVEKVLQFRECTRCGGDLHAKTDMYGDYKECLQCGYMLDITHTTNKFPNWLKSEGKPGRKKTAA